MQIKNIFQIQKNDIVSIVGSGGKTTTMFAIAQCFAAQNMNVLVCTTTKIFKPEKQYNKITVAGKSFDKTQNKIIGFSQDDFDEVIRKNNKTFEFDLILIESDGSKQKPLKGWKQTEPVVVSQTTKTIGVINLGLVGKKVSETHVHNFSIFCKTAQYKKGEVLQNKHIARIILSEEGLFKNSVGEKILFFNAVENDFQNQNFQNAKEIIKIVQNNNIKIVLGSAKNQEFFVCE